MQQRWALCAILGLALATLLPTSGPCAEGDAAPGPPAGIPDPYPAVARALNLPGKVRLACNASADGELRNCLVAGEDPVDWGFGEAALKMVPSINVGTGEDGRSVEVPISFKLDPDLISDPALKIPGFVVDGQKRTDFRRVPTADDFARTYPQWALDRDIGGVVTIACRVNAEGEMQACVFFGEDPPGRGFLEGARYLASRFQFPPRLPDGRSVENGVFKKRLRWTMH